MGNLSIDLDILFIVYAAIILVLLLFTRENKDSAVPMVVAPIICNIIHFQYVRSVFTTNIIEVLIFEVLAITLSVFIVKLIDWITSISSSIITIIFEIITSVGLVYFFYNIRVVIELILRIFK